MSYFDSSTPLKSLTAMRSKMLKNDVISYEAWLMDQVPGKAPRSELLPVMAVRDEAPSQHDQL